MLARSFSGRSSTRYYGIANFKTSLRGSKSGVQPGFLSAQISLLINDHHSDFFLDYYVLNQLRILSGLKVIAEVNAEARSFLDWQHYWLAPLLVDATDILLECFCGVNHTFVGTVPAHVSSNTVAVF